MEIKDVNKLIRTLNLVNGCDISCKYCYARNINCGWVLQLQIRPTNIESIR